MAEVDELGFKPAEDLGFKPKDDLGFKPAVITPPGMVRGSDGMLLGGNTPPEPGFVQLVKEEMATPFVELPKPAVEADDTALTRFGKGLAQSGIGAAEGLETPLGVSLLAASALPGVGKAIGRTAAAGFGIKSTLEGFKEAAQAYQTGDMEKAGRAVGNLILGGAMVRGSVAVPGAKTAAPRTAEALKRAGEILPEASKTLATIEEAVKPVETVAPELPPSALRAPALPPAIANMEHPVSAAFRDSNGKIWTGSSHPTTINQIPETLRDTAEMGFFTNKGRFVSYEQGNALGSARYDAIAEAGFDPNKTYPEQAAKAESVSVEPSSTVIKDILKDEHGNEIVAMHGTPEIDFDPAKIEASDWGHSGPGIYLTTDPKVASELYATAHKALPFGKVLTAKIVSKKPYGAGVFSAEEAAIMNAALEKNGYTPVKNLAGKTHKWLFDKKEEQAQDTWDTVMKDAGYDSVRIPGADEAELVVYDPKQIIWQKPGKLPAPQSSLGITPQPPEIIQRLGREIEGRALIDESRIKTAVAAADVMPGRDWLASPEFEFRKNPEAAALVKRLNEQELKFKHDVAEDRHRFEALQQSLSKDEQFALTKGLQDAQKGVPDAIEKLSPREQKAALEIRAFYDQIRDQVRADKAASIRNALTEAQRKALDALESGESFDSATTRLGDASKEAVKASLDEIKEAENWGIENYTTNIERGNYRVVAEEGAVAIGRTRAEAALKADKWLKEHPEVKEVVLDDEFSPGAEFPTKLSKGQYWRLVSRLEDATKNDAKEIQNLLHSQGSIVAVKPTLKYAAPLQRRRNVLKGEENVFDVLPLYSHIMRKKLALDPVLREAKNVLPRLPENMREQAEALVADVKGRKTVGDKIADYLLTPLGLEPFAYSRTIQTAKNVSAILKLGYRPVAAFVNRAGGLQHTWVKAGTKWLREGREMLGTPEGKRLIEENKPYIGMESSFTEAASEVPIYHPLGMFQRVERINRPEAFLSFYKLAREGMGMDEIGAVDYARSATRFAQFTYNMASLPRSMRGPTGRLLLQFKPYLVKELEFVSTLRGPEIARYMAGFLALGGPRAALLMARSLPVLGSVGVINEVEDWLNRELPRTSRGLPGAVGVDISPSVAFQLPTEVRDWLGPTVSELNRLYKDVIQPALKGEKRDLSDVREWAGKLAPILSAWSDLVDTFSTGEVRDWKGRLEYTPTQLDKLKMALGAKPLEKSILEVERRFLSQNEEVSRNNRSRLVEDYAKALRKGDEAEIDKLLEQMNEAGVDRTTIKRALREQDMTAHERAIRRLPRRQRAEERERRE